MEVGAKWTSIFSVGDRVDVVGTSRKRLSRGVRRHGLLTQYDAWNERRGAYAGIHWCRWSTRVFKGMRMAGHMGDKRITVKNLEVAQVRAQENILALKGGDSGYRNGGLDSGSRITHIDPSQNNSCLQNSIFGPRLFRNLNVLRVRFGSLGLSPERCCFRL